MRLGPGLAAFALSVAGASFLISPDAVAAGHDHGGAAIGGVVAGLVCGSGTLAYARLRSGGREARSDDPMLWHQAEGPGWIGAFFAEHAAAGGLTGAFFSGPRQGFVIGGLITCSLDAGWIIASEVIAAGQEQGPGAQAALIERNDGAWRVGMPPIVVGRDGAWASILAVRF
jgi:hypothetical protein